MPIDLAAAMAAPPTTKTISWTTRDVLLYHLSLGAGRGADPQLRWTYEQELQVLPTFALVAGQGPSAGELAPTALRLTGCDIDLRRILHAGQAVTVHRPLPAIGEATITTRIADLWDKGKAAVIVLEHSAVDPAGELLWTTRMQIWARGEGGFGGEAGPTEDAALPAREPDLVVERATWPDQALLYRLNGDLNPLHADPAFARAAGFEAPILHGLCSYGILAGAVVEELLDGDAARLAALEVRFAGTLTPGETLRLRMWREADRLQLLATCVERDDAPVLTHAGALILS
ncbi:MaoC/PaaZ C-terminal domain-containing protein [Nocardioides sp. Bht2]|uniref:MaoC/PaaZ C-terminal domain-containing protein n=1 Tax=Nocardioides sp. Bht2 TaxID=3392297 RepID=UPI0039B66BBE